MGELKHLINLVVFDRKMYYSDLWNNYPEIWSANMDGSGIELLTTEGLNNPADLYIDHYNRRLCFLDLGQSLITNVFSC